jgi:tripartite-type tricarboxylate transporter receptor subunit TctC
MRFTSALWKACLAGAAAIALAGATAAHAQVIDLSGQTVTLVHNAAPGGSTGLGAQIAADAWSKTMAGNPTIVVQSVEGGALARGIRHVMNARPDGRTLGWVAWSGSTRVLDPEELQIPFKDFGIIGGVGGAHFFVHVSTKVAGGLKDKDEFVKKVDKFTFGGFTALSAASMRTAAAMDLLGIDYQFVSGFGGDGPLQAALQRGEIQGYPATGVIYNRTLKDTMIKDGESLGLFYFSPPKPDGSGLSEDPFMENLETFDSYYRRVMGKEPSGPAWDVIKFHGGIGDRVNWLVVAPPNTPEEHLAMLRESFAQAVSDPEFLANAEKVFGQKPSITTYPDIMDVVDEVSRTDEALKETMRGYLKKMEH